MSNDIENIKKPEVPVHIVVDLETASTKPNAAIVAIGAAYIRQDMSRISVFDSFYSLIDIEDSFQYGGVSPATIRWWVSQEPAVRQQVLGVTPLVEALKDFEKWVFSICEDREAENSWNVIAVPTVWGNGSEFDNTILRNAYSKLRMQAPWSYKESFCYRTLKSMFPEIVKPEPEVTHHAMHDAIAEAEHLRQILIQLQTMKNDFGYHKGE